MHLFRLSHLFFWNISLIGFLLLSLSSLAVVSNNVDALETSSITGSTTFVDDTHGRFEARQIKIGTVDRQGYGHEIKLNSENAVIYKLLEGQMASLVQKVEDELVFEPNTRKKHVIEEFEIDQSGSESMSLTGDTITVKVD